LGAEALRHQYADFAVWQRAWLQGERLERQVAFWRKKLEGMPQVLELPADRARPAVPSFRGAAVAFELSATTVKALRELGRQEGATPFMVLLAGFQIFVARVSGQDDVAIGTPVANRHRAEVEPLIGFFVNTLVMRGRPEAGMTFRRWVRQVRDQAIEAFTHQDLPFDLLVERMNVERDLARDPLFQVVFSAQPAVVAQREAAGLTLEPVALAPESVRFDLECHMEVDTSAVRGQFVYATDLFDEARVRRMVEQFVTLLENAGGSPERRLGELSLLRTEETARVVEAWNATTTAYPREATVHGLFAEQAAKTPDAVAVTCGGESVTYAELERRANALARRLRAMGVRRETAVALCFERSFAMVVAQLAVLKAGGFFVPIDPELPRERGEAMLAEVRIEIVVTVGKFAGRWKEEKGGGSRGVKPLPQLLVVDGNGFGVDNTKDTEEAQRARREEEYAATDLAYVMFTSGSTGGPKGVGVPHRAVVRLVKATNFARFGADEVMLQLAPYSFDAATLEFWGALLNGGRLAIFPPGTPSVAEIAAFVQRERVTTMWLTAGLFHAVVEHAPDAFRGVKQLLAGGDVLLPEDCRKVLGANPGLTLINGYGPTESTTFACCHAMTAAEDVGLTTVPIGRPISNTRVYVLDTALNPCAAGVPGELFIGGDGLARGYVGQRALTAEKFVPDAFSKERGARLYRTGDRVRWGEDGRIEFLGRMDFQVKIRGFRVELGEIEAALARRPDVEAGVVVARAEAPGVKRLVAYVVGRAEQGFDRARLLAELRVELPDYLVPSAVVAMESLPLTANGKVDRKALVKMDASSAAKAGATAGSGDPALQLVNGGGYANEVEARIAGIWKDVLRVPGVGRDENFFGLGGDSILSIQIVARARAVGWLLTPAQLFQHQTVAELARVAVPVDVSAGTWAAVTGEVALTPVQRWWLGGEPVEVHHFNQAVLLEVARPMSREAVERVLAALDAHHDLLRGWLVRRGMNRKKAGDIEGTEVRGEGVEAAPAERDGEVPADDEAWEMTIGATGREVPLRWLELSGMREAERGAAVEAVCAEEQGRLEPEGGVMWRAVYFDFGAGRPGRLFVAVHHLVVDGVSWRILLEDLERAVAQMENGEAIALPAKTTSFKAWSERLAAAASRGEFAGERGFWRESARGGVALPRDFAADDDENVEATSSAITVRLDGTETERLLKRLPARRGVSVEAVLLACVVEAIGAWSGAKEIAVAMEGHGREEIFPDVDLSRTVGWFTAIYPLSVSLPAGVESVAAQLRAVPRRGVGFGALRYLAKESGEAEWASEPEVSFNYLGRFDVAEGGETIFAPAREERGAFVSPRARRHHVIEINGNVTRGELSVAWGFSRALHRAETIERMAQDFIGRVRALLVGLDDSKTEPLNERDEAIAEVEFN
jgi:amino acid adenylation domain-containing protein/non-ribosomal peptide synthase protein (TIGR01720 family)